MKRRCALLVTSEYPPTVGGMGAFVAGVGAGFVSKGWETLVIARKPSGFKGQVSLKTSEKSPRVIYRYAGIPGWDLKSIFFVGMWVLLRKRPSFILIGHWYPHAIVALVWRLLTGVPYFIIIHGSDIFPYNPNPLKHLIKRIIMKALPFFLSKANGLLPNSSYTRGLVLGFPGVRDERVAVLHPPVEHQFFQPVSEEEKQQVRGKYSLFEKRVILTVGHLSPRKGTSQVIEALPAILKAETKAHYLVVGDGTERESLEHLVDSLGLRSAVTFAGAVAHEQLPAYYALADVFALVTYSLPGESEGETFGIVYLEAAAQGKPVVAGTHGGVADAVIHGATGLLVDPLDTKAIAEAIISLLKDTEKAQAIGQAGRRRAISEFSPEAVAGKALEIMSKFQGKPLGNPIER